MTNSIEGLQHSAIKKFEIARQYLLPNERVLIACETRNGFLVLSNRRIVFLQGWRKSEYRIERAIPYDCIRRLGPKNSDRFEGSAIVLDPYGRQTRESSSFEVIAPRGARGSSKIDVNGHFQSVMSCCSEVIDEIRNSNDFARGCSSPPDYSYLKLMPESLTHNAVLDLNTILRDQPIHNELVHEAVKFLGDDPILLEESLRAGSDDTNGILFAAGSKGYYWIQGRKQGRFMSNVIVDTVEWENVRCFAYLWHSDRSVIYATYSLTRDGKEATIEYQWNLSKYEDTFQYPWLLQQWNGPWILGDISYKYSGKPLLAFYH